jgi:hypothetical protein
VHETNIVDVFVSVHVLHENAELICKRTIVGTPVSPVTPHFVLHYLIILSKSIENKHQMV